MIIFLSGWGFQSSIWENIASEFSSADVMFANPLEQNAFPLRGKVPSGGRGNKNHVEFLFPLPSFGHLPPEGEGLLSLPDNSILVGWSLGGMIAANLCQQFPGKFRKLITVACNPKFIATTDWPGVNENDFSQFYQQAKNNLPSLLKEFQRLAIGNNRDANIRKILQTHIHQPAQKELLLSHLDLLMQLDNRENYSEINIPTLHLFGNEDVLVPADCATRIRKNYPHHATHVIQRAGHIPFLTHKDEFMQQLRGFIHE